MRKIINIIDERTKAIFIVAFKRYSFVILIPILLYISYWLGKLIALTVPEIKECIVSNVPIIPQYIVVGLMTLILMVILFITLMNFLKFVKDSLLKLVRSIIIFIIKIPRTVIRRIKDEKRQFNDAVERELHSRRY